MSDAITTAAPATADAPVGAFGGPDTVVLAVALDADDVPTTLVAVTVNVYAVPSVRPVTVTGLVAPDAVCPPDDVTV